MAGQQRKENTSSGFEHRVGIVENLREQGIDPYPAQVERTHLNAEALALPEGSEVKLLGRITAIRDMGKIVFMDVVDASGPIQLVFQEGETEYLAFLENFDKSDWIAVTGKRFRTKSRDGGQESIMVSSFEMAAKATLPLPDKLTDPEARLRDRAADMAVNGEVRETLEQRSLIIRAIRRELEDMGFFEVDTPILQPIYGGAAARPFTTHVEALDQDWFLQISPEIFLKFAIMGGFDKVFNFGRDFRNEGISYKHHPEFTMLELYMVAGTYEDMMDITEQLYLKAALAAHGTPIVNYQWGETAEQTVTIDFSQPWRRLTMKGAIQEYLDLNVDDLSDEELQQINKEKAKAKKAARGEEVSEENEEEEKPWVRGLAIAELFEFAEEHLIEPVFIIDHPKETSPLCKVHPDDPDLILRFEPYIGGMEAGNAYSELNDSEAQLQAFKDQRADDPEAYQLDMPFVIAMRHGMPPTGGLGLGIDRLLMVILNKQSIKDVIFFPMTRRIQYAVE